MRSVGGDEAAALETNLVRFRLQQSGGGGGGLGDHLARRAGHRGTTHVHRPRPTMTVAGAHLRGIGLDITERFRRQTEQIGGDLRIGGLVALTVRLGADQ